MRSLRVLSFAVSLCIICGIIFGPISASAMYELDIDPWGDLEDVKNPGITDTPMVPDVEDPGDREEPVQEKPPMKGDVGLYSLNDSTNARYGKVTNMFRYGFTATSGEYNVLTRNQVSKTWNGSGLYLWGQIANYEDSLYYMRTGADATFAWLAPASYAQKEAAYISVNGAVEVAFWVAGQEYADGSTIKPSASQVIYPNTVQLLVNGEPYGNIYDFNSQGVAVFPADTNIFLDDLEITQLGYLFTFPEKTVNYEGTASESRYAYFYINDDAIFTHEVTETEPEYNGLLGTIIGWLQNLWNAITGLGSTIVNGLLDGISGLFVPDQEDIIAMQDKYDLLLHDRLGFIYQGFDATVTNVETIVTGMELAEEYSFTVPEISFTLNGEQIVILEETPVSLDNAAMDVLRGLFGTAVCVICVGAWLSLAFDMVVALISGIGYFEFLKRKGEDPYE